MMERPEGCEPEMLQRDLLPQKANAGFFLKMEPLHFLNYLTLVTRGEGFFLLLALEGVSTEEFVSLPGLQ